METIVSSLNKHCIFYVANSTVGHTERTVVWELLPVGHTKCSVGTII